VTIDQAIKILETVFRDRSASSDVRVFDAITLGKEALERLQEGRKVDHAFACTRLPGETEEAKCPK
jgi:hypothetical protein